MNAQQQIVLWVGLLLTLVYLFTDKTFHQALFTTSAKPGMVQDSDFVSQSTGIPATSTSGGTQLV